MEEKNERPKQQEHKRWSDLRKWELVEAHERLHQSIEGLQRARVQLAYTNRRLAEDNAALRLESGDLRKTNQKLHQAVRELGEENLCLLETNLRLADKNQHLTQQIALHQNSIESCPRGSKPNALQRLGAWIRAAKIATSTNDRRSKEL